MTRPHPRALGKAVEVLARQGDVSSRRMRRWVATTALAQVLLGAKARGVIRGFAIKGGHAIELRIRRKARASRDVDVIIDAPNEADVVDALRAALTEGWSGFTFTFRDVEKTERAFRFPMSAHYGNADWSTFEVEVVAGDVIEQAALAQVEIAALINRNRFTCTVAQVLSTVHAFALQLIGVTMRTNYEYRFLVLNVPQQVPTSIENAVTDDMALESFHRMTQAEGWRLAHLMRYPTRDQTRSMHAVLERPIENND